MKQGYILLLSGPSGAGKSTLLSKLLEDFKDELYFSVSYTTRAPREKEKDGINYHFISRDSFEKKIQNGDFLEYAKVHDNYYGTSLKEVLDALNANKIVVFDIDVQGFMQVKNSLKDKLCSVFVSTKDLFTLKQRLNNRATNDDNLKQRLHNASLEMNFLKEYDYFIINDDVNIAYDELKNIFKAEKLRITRYNVDNILQLWNDKGE
ncbi:deoxyguanylate kinase / guanylate kinase [Campylobacter avium LMG 24591]|uniref:Guanylate kinase n=1 Tax=Campylobacter avium LMG 24591 TaxID=522484 RepID=A0A222MW72_9BACT|nr:guanylate kinase [Campylobacter avium]ASQ30011.1 deoxyguanylate kinase / guanylate kinase [Campylobacter avium LMG 24591]OYD79110.1 deoxyguanylate kinase / guanylate kinase [Campylobacter avium]HJE65461.1 guanylate kinase [Campylobacter avium]